MFIPSPFPVFITLMLWGLLASEGIAQAEKLFIPVNIRNAWLQKTRSPDGTPGENYWQNKADYAIDVSFDPENLHISGKQKISYFNNSSDTLHHLLLMLLPDLFKAGNPRDFPVSGSDEHQGLRIRDFMIDSSPIDPSRTTSQQMFYESTSAWVHLPQPMLPGSSISIAMSWEYMLNEGSHMRTGQVDSSSFFLAYWFPRVGVYDDVDGWNNYRYTGVGEFYNDFGDFDVQITVPEGFIVWATGELQNPGTTFSEELFSRYQLARKSGTPVQIIGRADLGKPLTRTGSSSITWAFKAGNVSDFAFAIADHYLWDAVSLNAGTGGGPVFVSAAYHPGSDDFRQVTAMATAAITYMTEELPGLPFPYPSITVFNGLDEMEYPMMVNNKSFDDLAETFKLTAHEIGHSYFPFLTGCNERKYAWMDEGLTSFFEYNMIRDLVDSTLCSIYFLDGYREIMGSERDLPLFSVSELIRDPEYYAISYAKAVSFYSVLMQETGREQFRDILKEFAARWAGKHPAGHDFIHTVSDVAGRDLTWLIQPWLFEYGSVDLAIGSLVNTPHGYSAEVLKKGNLPAPVNLLITFSDGSTETIHEKPGIWSSGNLRFTVNIVTDKEIQQMELMFEIPMDSDPSNNFWR